MDFSFNEITKIIELFLSIVGLGLIIFGWLIPYKQSRKATIEIQKFEKKMQSARWEKELVDEQISKFYGPISELLNELELRRIFVINQLNRDSVFNDGKIKLSELTENEQKIWVHFIQTYCIPIQSKIIEIIQTNLHLVYNSEIPIGFFDFMDYVLGMEYLYNQKMSNIENYFEYYYKNNYPRKFNEYIKNTFDLLLSKQKELIKLYID